MPQRHRKEDSERKGPELFVDRNNPVLRGKAREVATQDIGTRVIKETLSCMREALAGEEDGVALAAPQIGVPLRIFIVWEGALTLGTDLRERRERALERRKDDRYLVFINPAITKRSREKEAMEEGCLSVRWLYGKVRRSKRATIVAYNENGVRFTRGASGILSQIFQHEVDHLDGTLFTDKATELKEIPPDTSDH